jgi:hypothetical protein
MRASHLLPIRTVQINEVQKQHNFVRFNIQFLRFEMITKKGRGEKTEGAYLISGSAKGEP